MQKRKTIKIYYLSFLTLFLMLTGCVMFQQPNHTPAHIVGVFWQPDLKTTPPQGSWQRLGATTFIPQWSIVDAQTWMQELDTPQWEKTTTLASLKKQAWAKHIILGLSGEYNETEARKNIALHYQQAQIIMQKNLPVDDYYFPIEADPSWSDVYKLGEALKQLPRSVWVSIYSAEVEPVRYDHWVKSWLPEKDKVFFQDGVGVGTRSPTQALKVYENLEKNLGSSRTAIVLEAFRPKAQGGFRAAYPWEIIQQLKAYEGKTVYLFDGPHYLNRWTVYTVQLWYKLHYA
ncbi:hypothetical protein C9E89_012015 [Acinetobacter sichuanensis]|uniref:Uncharacterized protein n=2 Tax=Acinetobacter sichuanensis TaxID=2136183 RepID=A0A371YPA4_9GAMM|nr:hypothetical protein C9E89_012015 [Acinetobacter sichuanensis]